MKSIYSLKNKQLFQKVLTQGKKIYSNNFSIFFLLSDQTKIGISVPKKSGDAVFRNKQKRQIRNILSNFEKLSSLNKNIVIITKPNFYKLTFNEKSEIIINELNKLI